MKRKKRRQAKGFTLIELLVATSIMVFLLAVLSSTAFAITAMWQRGIAHNERRQAAIHAFSRITRDLHSAHLPINPAKSPVFVINHKDIGNQYKNPQSIFFENNENLNGYFVQWVNNKTPILCRLKVPRGPVINDDLIVENAPGDKDSGYEGLLAENVLGIWFQPMDAKNEPIKMEEGYFDSINGYISELDKWRHIWAPPDDTHSEWWIKETINEGPFDFKLKVPAYVKVSVVVVDQRTAIKLTGAEIPPKPLSDDVTKDAEAFRENLPDQIKRGSGIFSTSIIVLNQG